MPLPAVVPSLFDPWQHYMKPVAPPESLLRSSADAFQPSEDAAKTIQLMQELINRQNDTIAALTVQIDSLSGEGRASAFGGAGSQCLEARVSALAVDIQQLGASLGPTVQRSLDARLGDAGVFRRATGTIAEHRHISAELL